MQHVQATWYRQPLIWLAALIFFALLAGCIATIVVAGQYPDDTLQTGSDRVLKTPIERFEPAVPDASVPTS